jgi:imidazolonepropionase-like amidohydrolase
MAAKGVASVPTVVPYDYIFDAAGGYWGSTSRRFAFSKAANVEMIRRLKRAGVTIGVGTDLVVEWFRYMPEPYLTELGHLVEAGFTPAEALVAATKTNASLLDLADRLGTLEPGKLADVLVVRGTPDSNVPRPRERRPRDHQWTHRGSGREPGHQSHTSRRHPRNHGRNAYRNIQPTKP